MGELFIFQFVNTKIVQFRTTKLHQLGEPLRSVTNCPTMFIEVLFNDGAIWSCYADRVNHRGSGKTNRKCYRSETCHMLCEISCKTTFANIGIFRQKSFRANFRLICELHKISGQEFLDSFR